MANVANRLANVTKTNDSPFAKSKFKIMSQSIPTIVIDITPENFPRCLPALQNYIEQSTEDARNWVDVQNFPPELASRVFVGVLIALSRDAVLKLEVAIAEMQAAEKGPNSTSHFVEDASGAYRPLHFEGHADQNQNLN